MLGKKAGTTKMKPRSCLKIDLCLFPRTPPPLTHILTQTLYMLAFRHLYWPALEDLASCAIPVHMRWSVPRHFRWPAQGPDDVIHYVATWSLHACAKPPLTDRLCPPLLFLSRSSEEAGGALHLSLPIPCFLPLLNCNKRYFRFSSVSTVENMLHKLCCFINNSSINDFLPKTQTPSPPSKWPKAYPVRRLGVPIHKHSFLETTVCGSGEEVFRERKVGPLQTFLLMGRKEIAIEQ